MRLLNKQTMLEIAPNFKHCKENDAWFSPEKPDHFNHSATALIVAKI